MGRNVAKGLLGIACVVASGSVLVDSAHAAAQAVNFNGSTQYIDVGKSPSIKGLSHYSLCLWVKLAALPALGLAQTFYYETISTSAVVRVKLQVENQDTSYANVANAFEYRYRGTDASAARNVPGSANDATTSWHHLCATYDNNAGVQKLYVDDSVAATDSIAYGTISNTVPTDNIHIGDGDGGETTNGAIQDVRLYSIALTQSQIDGIYNSGNGSCTDTIGNLLGWWKLSEGGTTAPDSSGNGNNGTLMNGASWTTGLIDCGAPVPDLPTWGIVLLLPVCFYWLHRHGLFSFETVRLH